MVFILCSTGYTRFLTLHCMLYSSQCLYFLHPRRVYPRLSQALEHGAVADNVNGGTPRLGAHRPRDLPPPFPCRALEHLCEREGVLVEVELTPEAVCDAIPVRRQRHKKTRRGRGGTYSSMTVMARHSTTAGCEGGRHGMPMPPLLLVPPGKYCASRTFGRSVSTPKSTNRPPVELCQRRTRARERRGGPFRYSGNPVRSSMPSTVHPISF